MPSDLSFVCVDEQTIYDDLKFGDEQETKKSQNGLRTLNCEKKNPIVFARWNPERGEEGSLEIVKCYSLDDQDQDENLKMAKSACTELNIMKYLRENRAYACSAELYDSHLISRQTGEKLSEHLVKALLRKVKNVCDKSRRTDREEDELWDAFEEIVDQVKEIEITIEYGVSLKRFVERVQKDMSCVIDAQQKIMMLFEALKALQHLEIMHQDVKPDNVILVQRDTKIVPVFIDFDVSSFFDREKKSYVYYEGSTPRYQSPEQAGEIRYDKNAVENKKRKLTRATDVYSMAVVSCEILDSHFPNTIAGRKKILNEFAQKDALHKLLAEALNTFPEERPTVEAIVARLMKICADIPVVEAIEKVAEAAGPFGKLVSLLKKIFKSNGDGGGIKTIVVKIKDIIIHNSAVAIVAIVALGFFFGYLSHKEEQSNAPAVSDNTYETTLTFTNSSSYELPTTTTIYLATTATFHTFSDTTQTLALPAVTDNVTEATVTSADASDININVTDNEGLIVGVVEGDINIGGESHQPESNSFSENTPYADDSPTVNFAETTVAPTTTTTTTTVKATTLATTTTPAIITGVDENGLAYEIVDGRAVITGYYGTATEVVIPEYVAGVPVYAIGENAFATKEIASVEILGDNVKGIQRIGEGAFRGCTYLQYVILPISIKYIGSDAFTRNYDIESIVIYYRDSSVMWDQIEKTPSDFEKDYIEISFSYGVEW